MDEEENVLNDTPEEVVDPLPANDEQPEVVEPEQDEQEQEVVEPDKAEQSPEANAIYKKMRLKAQEEIKKELDTERQKIAEEKAELLAMRQEREARETEQNVYDKLLTSENIANKAYEEGVSEDIAARLIKAEAQTLIASEKTKVSQKYEAMNKQKNELKSDEFFPLIEKEVDDIVNREQGVDFKTAYKYVVGQKYKELQKKVSENATKKTLADVQDRARRKPITSDSGSNDSVNPSSVLSREALDMAAVFGIDPKKVAKRIRDREK